MADEASAPLSRRATRRLDVPSRAGQLMATGRAAAVGVAGASVMVAAPQIADLISRTPGTAALELGVGLVAGTVVTAVLESGRAAATNPVRELLGYPVAIGAALGGGACLGALTGHWTSSIGMAVSESVVITLMGTPAYRVAIEEFGEGPHRAVIRGVAAGALVTGSAATLCAVDAALQGMPEMSAGLETVGMVGAGMVVAPAIAAAVHNHRAAAGLPPATAKPQPRWYQAMLR